jgi:NADH:ubiquinone oxidoreductase subunit 5 (subunit L)/multisubunit Na+/H+ antiporter MnhA subunit
VGLCSYLLINFWSTRILANKAAIKAILINKIGDCGLLLALGLIVYTSETLHFDIFFAVIKQLVSYSFYSSYFIFNTDVFTLIGLFLLIGVMGKSAQFGLHS